VNFAGWDEPATPVSDDHEQVVEAVLLKTLDDSIPAAVTSARAGGHYPALSLPAGRRLDLDAMKLVLALSQQVAIRAVTKRNPDAVPLLHEPSRSDSLADVPLLPWI
jgi:hypothetical protein